MALALNKPNFLNYFNLRKVNFPVPYFEYLTISKYQNNIIKNIEDWINQNLNGRYYIGKNIILDNTNSIVYNTKIGFEEAKELSYFILTCPFIQKNN